MQSSITLSENELRHLLFLSFNYCFFSYLLILTHILSPVCPLKVRLGTNSCPSVKYEHSYLQNRAKT